MTKRNSLLLICIASCVIGGLPALLSAGEPAAGKPVETTGLKPDGSTNIDKAAAGNMADFDCGSGKPGWKRAKAVTPNLVGPCKSGSGGICESRFEYVPGTGWCRPR